MQVCGSTTENYRNEIFQHFHYFARPRRKRREQVKQFKSNVKFFKYGCWYTSWHLCHNNKQQVEEKKNSQNNSAYIESFSSI